MTIGRIYKITDNTNDNIYIGSTTKQLNERLKGHEYDYKRYLNGKFNYITSFMIIKNNDYDIELIEELQYNLNDELFAREGHFISILECVNKFIPNRTKKEYYIAHKEAINDQHKQYREAHKEQKRIYDKQYRLQHKKIKKPTINQTFKELKEI